MKCASCGADLGPDATAAGRGSCPYCGSAIDEAASRTRPVSVQNSSPGLGWEYKSSLEFFGLPLIHIASGVDPETGRPLVAKGIIAIGNIAFGVFALGGVAVGGLTLGGASLGAIAVGGAAAGGVATGGLAIGGYFALGGLAISLKYAVGGAAIAPCALGGTGGDPACFEPLLEKLEELELWPR